MNLTLTSVLLLFGIFQSIVMILLILITRNRKQIQNKLLISILGVLGLSILPTFLGNSGIIQNNPNLMFLPVRLSIFVFPLLFLYVKSVFVSDFKIGIPDLKHLVFPFVFWIYSIILWINTIDHSLEAKGAVALTFYYFQIKYAHDVSLLLMLLIYTWFAYQLINKAKNYRLSKNQLQFYKWLKYLFFFLMAGAILDLVSIVIGEVYGYWKGSPLDELLGISFTILIKIYYSIIVYVISVIGYASYSKFIVSNYPVIDNAISNKIIEAMEVKKMFLNPDLSLRILAEDLDTTTGVVSKIINTDFKVSFNDFVNKYRIEEVKNKLDTNSSGQFTLLALAQDSGFKSKTTFYRAFQKFTSHTPKSYLKTLNSQK
ncbi:hypothetical protein AWE51_01550 [Aquimarina aggregata]|uniref:HTH araC/xylS-type domain-containing protein n=1 Tax=Aquimarina aggregata TaxID=1642818 RepID=A0A163C8G9_9FLAO|nr:helix-turn-helix domain-containing protein [Aquimarina aggregata]KZS42155.1 hypothetical protein AWE51_01550 [Aquimarina aggregata]